MRLPVEILEDIVLALKCPHKAERTATTLVLDITDKIKDLNKDYAIDNASRDGNVSLLQWWKASGLECKYTYRAMNSASREGHVDVLDWWKASGFEIKYTSNAMDMASEDGHVGVLDWWKASGL